MKKILGLGLVAILVMAMVGGGTWAYFSDYEASSGNTLTAGTLDLGLANTSGAETGGSATATWTSPSSWAPGDEVDKILYVKNSGSIDMATVTVYVASNVTEGTPSTVKLGDSDPTNSLGKQIVVKTATWNGTNIVNLGGSAQTLFTANNTGTPIVFTLPTGLGKGEEEELHMVFMFSTNATNSCQGDTATLTAVITGTQQ